MNHVLEFHKEMNRDIGQKEFIVHQLRSAWIKSTNPKSGSRYTKLLAQICYENLEKKSDLENAWFSLELPCSFKFPNAG